MKLRQKDLWCVEITLPGQTVWSGYFNQLPNKEMIVVALENETERYNISDGYYYARMLEVLEFWNEKPECAIVSIRIAGVSIGKIECSKSTPCFEVIE